MSTRKALLVLAVLMGAAALALALLLADAEDRKGQVLGGAPCTAISHVNEPVWDGKSWYMSGWRRSEAESAIERIGLTLVLRIEWLKAEQEQYQLNAAVARTSVASVLSAMAAGATGVATPLRSTTSTGGIQRPRRALRGSKAGALLAAAGC